MEESCNAKETVGEQAKPVNTLRSSDPSQVESTRAVPRNRGGSRGPPGPTAHCFERNISTLCTKLACVCAA